VSWKDVRAVTAVSVQAILHHLLVTNEKSAKTSDVITYFHAKIDKWGLLHKQSQCKYSEYSMITRWLKGSYERMISDEFS